MSDTILIIALETENQLQYCVRYNTFTRKVEVGEIHNSEIPKINEFLFIPVNNLILPNNKRFSGILITHFSLSNYNFSNKYFDELVNPEIEMLYLYQFYITNYGNKILAYGFSRQYTQTLFAVLLENNAIRFAYNLGLQIQNNSEHLNISFSQKYSILFLNNCFLDEQFEPQNMFWIVHEKIQHLFTSRLNCNQELIMRISEEFGL